MNRILLIVEGEGDLAAVPVLARRVLEAHDIYDADLTIQRRGELPKVKANFERYLKAASKENANILWVLDFDCDDCECVVSESQYLYQMAATLMPTIKLKIAFIIKEFESLFLAEQVAARRVLKIADTEVFPPDSESVRDAKGWLSKALPKGSAYKPTVHQAKIAANLNLDQLRHASNSFKHFEACLLELVQSN